MGERNNSTDLTYDPSTGTWVPSSSTSNNTGNSSSSNSSSSSQPSTPQPSPPQTGNPSYDAYVQGEADKQYIKAEFNALTGELRVNPTSTTICIKVNDTIRIEGLGRYLSGLYFVSGVTRSLSADEGYTHSFQLIKNGFGSGKGFTPEASEIQSRTAEVVLSAPGYKVGDTVKIVGADAVYSNASDGVKVPEWVKQKTLTIKQISEDKSRVLLMPINSWTYVKYIQKV